MNFQYTCPVCGTKNNDNWPVKDPHTLLPEWGGCQECWEAETSDEWWYECAKLERHMEQQKILDSMMKGEISIDEARDQLDYLDFREQVRKHRAKREQRRLRWEAFKSWFAGLFTRFA